MHASLKSVVESTIEVKLQVHENCWKGNANEEGTWPKQVHY